MSKYIVGPANLESGAPATILEITDEGIYGRYWHNRYEAWYAHKWLTDGVYDVYDNGSLSLRSNNVQHKCPNCGKRYDE